MRSSARQQLLLGIDIGGTKAVVAVARASGEILAESRIEQWARGSWREDLETLIEEARKQLERSQCSSEGLRAIGISAPGPLNPETGRVLEAPNIPGWEDVPIGEAFREAFGVRVLLENDANAGALAEWRFGAGKGSRHMLFLTVSTGIGGGLILDGRLHRGATFQAGEVGHIPVVPDGRSCNCGLRGCLEAYVGGAALAELIREDIERGEASAILAKAEGNPARVSAQLWVEALRERDPYAQGLRESFLDHLAQGLAILIPIFDPDCVVLGTIVARNPDLFLDALTRRVRERTWPSLHHVRLEPGRLDERLPAYAALSVASLDPEELSAPR